jgi:hypothetical protein
MKDDGRTGDQCLFIGHMGLTMDSLEEGKEWIFGDV